MAKRKWSWKHRQYIAPMMTADALHEVLRFCVDKFGNHQGEHSTRWDYTATKRRSKYSRDNYYFYNVQLFFKHKDDYVMYKLAWPGFSDDN